MRTQVQRLSGEDSSDDGEEEEEQPKNRKLVLADEEEGQPNPTAVVDQKTGRSKKWDWQIAPGTRRGGFWFCRACNGEARECRWKRTNPECACGGNAEVCNCWSPESF